MKPRSLKEMYDEKKKQPSPAASFIMEIAKLTHHSKAAVRKWVKGLARPDMGVQIILSKHFGIPYDELFPAKAS